MAVDRRQSNKTPGEIEREEIAKAKQKLATQRFYFLIAMLVLIVIFAVWSLILWIRMPRLDENGKPLATGGPFSVQTLTLEGNTAYPQGHVLSTSGVVVGQSIFSVKADEIEQLLMKTYPQYSSVNVETLGMKEVKITVTETPIIGAMYADGAWVLIGENGNAVAKRAIDSDRPKGILYIKGVKPANGKIVYGSAAMSADVFEIVKTMTAAIDRYQLTDVIEIDLTNTSDIRMNWRGQIEVKLGNSSNLSHEIKVSSENIPRILELRGEQITGVLNVSSYSDEALKDQAVFTPTSVLNLSTLDETLTEESAETAE